MDRRAMLEGPIGPTMIKLTIPMVWGVLSVLMINVVDTFYVGRLGAMQLAAMSFTFPVSFVVHSVAVGIGVGASAAIAQAIGLGDVSQVRRLTTDALSLAFLLVVVLSGLGLLTIDPVFRALGAGPELLPMIREYMTLWYLGVGMLVVPMVGNSAIRATGDTTTASRIMILAGLVNMVLDPLLIFGIGPFPRLEIAGAALATVISWMLTMLTAFWVLGWRDRMLEFRLPAWWEVLASWRKILYVGLPSVLTSVMTPISVGILTRLAAGYGPAAVAAFGVGGRMESLVMTIPFALSTVLSPFVGQNFGARKHGRLRDGIRFSARFGLLWGGGVFLLCLLLAAPVARLFSPDEEVRRLIRLYLICIPISYGPYGVVLLVQYAFSALRDPLKAAVVICVRLFVLVLPLALLGARHFGLQGLFLGIAIGNILAGCVAVALMTSKLRRLHRGWSVAVDGVGDAG